MCADVMAIVLQKLDGLTNSEHIINSILQLFKGNKIQTVNTDLYCADLARQSKGTRYRAIYVLWALHERFLNNVESGTSELLFRIYDPRFLAYPIMMDSFVDALKHTYKSGNPHLHRAIATQMKYFVQFAREEDVGRFIPKILDDLKCPTENQIVLKISNAILHRFRDTNMLSYGAVEFHLDFGEWNTVFLTYGLIFSD
jgi:hypothetical protein